MGTGKWRRWSPAALVLLTASACLALTPQEVAVVANAADRDSVAIAGYYARARGIPKRNILALPMPTTFELSRADYERRIRLPLARGLKRAGLAKKIRCLCLIRGVPVGIAARRPRKPKTPPGKDRRPAGRAGKGPLDSSDATVDSELALLWLGAYKLDGPAANPLYWKNAVKLAAGKAPRALLTARIDGPSRADAARMIKAARSAEKAGLRGTFYIDAGGHVPEYDAHLRRLRRMVKTHTKLRCVMDERRSVFQANSCPKAALYVGWSSPRRYVPAFSWVPGAVAWHIAGGEADSLRQPHSRRWCGKMIQNGVAATLGAVGHPRLGAFPRPEKFFALLLTGKYTLADCYWRTVPHASWRMTLIGDPLYNPFKNNPQLPVSALPKGLAVPK